MANLSELTKNYKMVKGEEKSYSVPRYKKSNKEADYNNFRARKFIDSELNSMVWEIKKSEKSSSTLIADEHDRITHRAFTKSTFPTYMREAGISSTNDFNKVIQSKKGVRFNRLKKEAIDRLEKGYKNHHGYNEPDTDFLVASKQLYDNKNVIFRRVRGKIIAIKVPYEKRYDLVPF